MTYDLLTKGIRDKLPPLYSQEHVKDPIVHVKFFAPWTNWTWYATEFDGKDTFFGWVVGFEKELGYFSLSEMQTARGPMGLKIERDIYFVPKPLSEVMAVYGERMPSVTRYPAVVRKDRELPTGPICSACGGPLMYMGTLGRKEWYRCRNCGMEFHRDTSKGSKKYMPAVAPQTEGSMKTPGAQHRFALYKCWLDSRGEERKVKVRQGTVADLNRWAKAEGLTFKSDSSLFGGYYLGPADEWYTADIISGLHLGGPTKLASPQTGKAKFPPDRGPYREGPRYRQFAGERFLYYDFETSKERAEANAAQWRKKGHKVRIVETRDGFDLFRTETEPWLQQTGAPRELPVIKGYTIDYRLRQFRKAEPGKSLVFIHFDSEKGRKLLKEMEGLGRVPQTGSAWAKPDRKLLDRLEEKRRSDPDGFYALVKQVRQEIKNREHGKIKMFPDIGVMDLRNILKQAERMYR